MTAEGHDMQDKPRYIMVGGFLGAGKSTAVVKLADNLAKQGQRVGLITNDQSVGLVDTAFVRSHGFAVEEIPGGCFCCRFDSLVEAAQNLQREAAPQVFIAEPVGSCTDLVASVSYPLRRIYGNDFAVAPLSVLVDPVRARRVLGLDDTKSFSQKVTYIYLKQLEEAEVIVINKVDVLDDAQLDELRTALEKRFPHTRVFAVSARHGDGLEQWFEHITSHELAAAQAMELDYETYADGEALLGWLNATVKLYKGEPFDGETVMMDIAQGVQQRLADAGFEIAHLKMTLMRDGAGSSSGPSVGDMATLNLVRSDFVPEMSQSLHDKLRAGELIVNIRAEADPDLLKSTLTEVLRATCSAAGVEHHVDHVEHFRPAKPTPTHRMDRLEAVGEG